MSSPAILDEGGLASGPGQLSVLSYNILVPNREQGWWVFKAYDHDLPMQARAWPHRRALLLAQLLASRADVICLQETLQDGFQEDLAPLRDAGYELLQHRKQLMRPATLWRSARLAFVQARHCDRSLVTTLRCLQTQRLIHLVNAHLSGGPAPAQRVRQLEDALLAAQRDARAAGVDPAQAAVIICGDLNATPDEVGVHRFLSCGLVEPSLREPGADEPITHRPRRHPFGPLREVYALAYGPDARPATFAPRALAARLWDAQTQAPSAELERALRAIFQDMAGGPRMDARGVARWLSAIQGHPQTRSGESARAAARLEASGPQGFEAQSFVALYAELLGQSRAWWSVAHDLAACGHPLDPAPSGRAWATLDHLYVSAAFEPLAVRAPLSAAALARLEREDAALPNAWHPSDHLPIGALLRLGEPAGASTDAPADAPADASADASAGSTSGRSSG